MTWFLNFAVSILARLFKDWRRDGELKDLGAAENANAAMVEQDRRGSEGDDIDRRLEAMTDTELDAEADRLAELRGDK